MKNFSKAFIAITLCILSTQLSFAQISGVVFYDFNNNGTKDASAPIELFAPGIAVNAYSATNTLLATTTTNASGFYQFTGSPFNVAGTPVRIEFITPTGLAPTVFNGTNNGTNVQFATAPAATVNYALNDPSYYYTATANLASVQNLNGLPTGLTNPGMYVFDWNKTGAGTFTVLAESGNKPTPITDLQNIGATWGVAYDNRRKYFFASAVLKRHHGLGTPVAGATVSQSLGGIYVRNISTISSAAVDKSFTLQGIAPSNGGANIDFGTVDRTTNSNFTLGATNASNIDLDAFAKVGKIGIGDIEIDQTGNKLWVVNLNQIALISVDIAGALSTFGTGTINQYPLAGLPGWPSGSVIRPWGLKFYRGKGYLGVVNTMENKDLSTYGQALITDSAYVLEFDPNASTISFTTKVAIPLVYTNNREGVGGGGGFTSWRAWKDTALYWPVPATAYPANNSLNTFHGTNRKFAQPILSGIEFDERGNMIIGILDRWSMQSGALQKLALTGYPYEDEEGLLAGDILKAYYVASTNTWHLEGSAPAYDPVDAGPNSTTDGPYGLGEFYYGDYNGSFASPAHNEIANGALAVRYGTGEVANTSLNPTAALYRNGVKWYSTTTGDGTDGYTIIQGDAARPSTLGKDFGMGDLELLADPQPLQIGNRIWLDADGDGVQDAGEAGINGVAVELVSPGPNGIFGDADDVVVATTTTAGTGSAAGSYYFSALSTADARKPASWTGVGNTILPGYDYQVRVANISGGSQQASLAGLQLTTTNTAANSVDNIDNDATVSGTSAVTTFNTNSTNHNFDFGFKPLASLGDVVWRDDDKDGIQDAGEPGVAGVTVTLYQNGTDGIPGTADDIVVGTTVTDAYGKYLFDYLTPSRTAATSYNVGFTLPANYQFTTQTNTQVTGTSDATNTTTVTGGSTSANGSDANVSTGRTGSFWLAPGEAERGVDAGIIFNTPVATNSIGNRVWYDTDGLGDQDANEPGVAGVTVTLYAADGVTVVATTVTDVNGNYLFTGLPPNTDYKIGVTPPAGMLFTSSGGTTPANDNDSDIDPATGKTLSSINTGAAGTSTLTIDAGLIPQLTSRASLGDRVWYDNDRDGVQDAGEPGIAGVTVQLLAADGVTVLATTVTDAFGNYIFPDLLPGDYRVGFGAVAGLQRTTANSTSGTIPDATNSDANVTTGVTGVYTLVAGEKNMSVDAGYYSTQPAANVGALGDKVWNDLDGDGVQDANEPGVAGITVTLYNSLGVAVATTTTDINGNYLFPNLTPGDYSVGFSNLPAGFGFTGQDKGGNDATDSDANPATGRTALVTVVGGTTNTTVDAGIRQGNNSGLGSLGDRVWYDLDNNGIQDAGELGVAGVTVTLLDAGADGIVGNGDDGPSKTTTTNALGEYIFDGLPAGNYAVQFSNLPVGFTLSATNAGANDAADSDGGAIGTGGAPAGASRTAVYSLAQGEDNLTVDLGLVPPANTYTLGGTAWFDTDSDGLQTGNPARVPGVMVTLYNSAGVAIATTTTDDNGDYLFVGLAAGDYSVGFSNYPTGYDVTVKEGTNTTAGGSDPDRISGRTSTVTLGAGNPDDRSLDAGLVSPRAALGNYVWDDLNRDGIQDAGETPVAGVTVSLYFDADGNGTISGSEATTPVATAITGADGKYFFPNLTPGNYQVGFTTLPTGMEFTTQDNTTGPDGDGVNSNGVGGDSDVSPSTGRTGIINLSANEVDLTVDAGIRVNLPATIGNKVWADINTDGIQDANEPGIAGVLVTLYNSSNQPIGSAVTDGNGNWQITNVPTGTDYYVIFTSNLPGFDVSGSPGTNPAWTTQNIGANGTQALDSGTESDTDSDVTASGANAGRTGTFSIVPGNNFPNIDAGIINWPLQNILPIQLVSFTAQPQNNTVVLNWVVNTETNVSNYEVEYSSNGVNFVSIGSKTATGSRSYNLLHTTPKQGFNYYRLKVIDRDGKVSYSEIRKVNFGLIGGSVKVYPIPAITNVNITVTNAMINQSATISVLSIDGRLVHQQNISALSQTETISVSKLAAGKYILRIVTSNEVVNKQVEVIR
ncbi:MAG: T9SS type A sorting domain-containing protein [Ferruginibacter sp.]|nr:T9SS type A sorting domain-containing protein [Ferruginibacter sp.]